MSGTAGDPNAGGGQGGQDWMHGFADEDRAYVGTKKWNGPKDVLQSYRNLETLQRTPRERLLTLPENMDDAAGMAPIYARLGRPEKEEGYELPEIQLGPGETDLRPWLRKVALQANLTKQQAKVLADAFVANGTTMRTEAEARRVQREQTEQAELKREWGDQFESNTKRAAELYRRAYEGAGYANDQEMQKDFEAIERQVGYRRMMKLMAFLGKGLGEHGFVNGDPAGAGLGDGGLTPEQAQAKMDELTRDGEFMKRYAAGDTAAQEKFRGYAKIASRGGVISSGPTYGA